LQNGGYWPILQKGSFSSAFLSHFHISFFKSTQKVYQKGIKKELKSTTVNDPIVSMSFCVSAILRLGGPYAVGYSWSSTSISKTRVL
jgi:hypothetical protein